jgi:hypothetical protein
VIGKTSFTVDAGGLAQVRSDDLCKDARAQARQAQAATKSIEQRYEAKNQELIAKS